MESDKEDRVLLAVQAFRNDPKLSTRAAARMYSVSHATLSRRLRGTISQRDSRPKSRKLTDEEEAALLQQILDPNIRNPLRLNDIESMANRLLAERGEARVGKRWASNFIRRHPQVKVNLTRYFDYSRLRSPTPGAAENDAQRTPAPSDSTQTKESTPVTPQTQSRENNWTSPSSIGNDDDEVPTVDGGSEKHGRNESRIEFRTRQRASVTPTGRQHRQAQDDQGTQQLQEARQNYIRRRTEKKRRCCRKCGNPGHNARTCQEDDTATAREDRSSSE
ncbi:hypothetical protein VTN31DRAFT_1281 [Thermomyces dupontii]|uniref:uncharacterized protein n=1 Tax=Talaromyces thermophilus TaxID=28565 RepID=UPI003744AA5C